MRRADGQQARVRVRGVYVVQVDAATALTGRVPEQERERAVLAGEVSERALVIDLLLHDVT